jgi:hypothetical protein
LGLTAAQFAGQQALSTEQLASANAEALARTGMNLEQLEATTGMNAAQLAGSLAGQAGQLGQSQAQMGVAGAQAGAGLGLQGAEMTNRVAEGIGGLGTSYGQLGLAQGSALGQLGLQQSAVGELAQALGQKESQFMFDMGKNKQAQEQAELEAQRQTAVQQAYEPYQRLSFLGDIYKGAPSSQQTIAATSSPSVSPAQQILGLGAAGLSAYAGAQRSGVL